MSQNDVAESAANDVAQILSLDINPFTGKKQDIGKFNSGKTWSIHVGQEPNEPEDVITVYDSLGGLPPIPCVNKVGTEGEFQTPQIQIRVRSKDYLSASNKINQCYKAIQNLGPLENTIFKYSAFYAQSVPFHIGEDSNNRQLWVVNFNCYRSRWLSSSNPSGSPSPS